MLITTVPTLLAFAFLLVVSIINEPGICLYNICLCLGCLCVIYFGYWLLFKIFHKKEVDQITKDLDELFDRQNRLLGRISKLQSPEKPSEK